MSCACMCIYIYVCDVYTVYSMHEYCILKNHPKSAMHRKGIHFTCVIWGIFSEECITDIN